MSKPDRAADEHWRLVNGRLKSVVGRLVRNQDDQADVLQQTMVTLLDRSRSGTILNPFAYAVTVARHFAYRLSRNRLMSNAEMDEPVDEQANPEEDCLQQQELASMRKALAQLPPLRREVFIRRRVKQQSRSQIALEMGLTEDAVKKHINRALAQLALQLKTPTRSE